MGREDHDRWLCLYLDNWKLRIHEELKVHFTQKWCPTKLYRTFCQTHKFQVKCGYWPILEALHPLWILNLLDYLLDFLCDLLNLLDLLYELLNCINLLCELLNLLDLFCEIRDDLCKLLDLPNLLYELLDLLELLCKLFDLLCDFRDDLYQFLDPPSLMITLWPLRARPKSSQRRVLEPLSN